MQVLICEDSGLEDTRIEIYCREVDDDILKIVAQLRVYERRVTGMRDGQTYIVDAAKILYLDTVDKKTFFYTREHIYETQLRLYELEEKLGKGDFFRASKSTIINFSQIQSLRPDFGGKMQLQMKNGERLFVSRQYVPVLKKKLGI